MILEIKIKLQKIIGKGIDIEVTSSEKEEFGHYSTNVAFKLAPILKKSPFEAAQELVERFKVQGLSFFEKWKLFSQGLLIFG